MGQNFHVQVLNDKEFDSLPYRNISNSLGIADPEKEMAFVRESGLGKEFDFATLVHEVNHLVETHKTDVDEDGIMHKKGGAARSIVPMILGALAAPFTGGTSLIPALLGTASSIGMNQYAQARHPEELGKPGEIGSILTQGLTGAASGLGGAGVAGGIAGGIKGATEAAPGFLSKAGGLVKGVGTGLMKGAGAFAPTPAANQGIVSGANSLANTFNASQAAEPLLGSSVSLGGKMANITGGVTRGLTAAAPAFSSLPGISNIGISKNLLGNTPLNTQVNPLSTSPVAQTPVTPAIPSTISAEPAPSFGSKIGKGIESFAAEPQNILGLGSSLLASQVKQPEFQMPPSVEEIRKTLLAPQGGLTDVGKQARIELGEILKSTPQQLYPPQNDAYYQAALRRTRDSYAIAKKNLDAQYNLAGVYGSGEHLASQAKLQEQLTNAETDLFAATEARNFELARTAKYQAIQDSLGVDKDVMDDLVGLTGLDVQQAAIIYGAKVQDVQAIREALGTLGAELLSRGKVQGQTQPAIE